MLRLIAIILLLIGFTSSCTTFQRVKRKFGHMATETRTVTVMDTLTVPKDSVVLRTKTLYDTSTVYLTERQGRATVIYQRGPRETTVRAICDTLTVIKEVKAECPPVVNFGVDPRWKWAAIAAGGLLAVLILAGGLLMLLSRWYTIQRK